MENLSSEVKFSVLLGYLFIRLHTIFQQVINTLSSFVNNFSPVEETLRKFSPFDGNLLKTVK